MKYPEDFDTTDELREYTIRIIRELGLCESVKQTHPDIYIFFKSLFQRHPEKERKEVSLITDISIRRFPKANRYQALEVKDHQFFIITKKASSNKLFSERNFFSSCI